MSEPRQPTTVLVADLTRRLNETQEQLARLLAERDETEGRRHKQEHDRRIGQEIQQGLLPRTMPRLPGFEISGRSLPANVVGGDCFDFIDLPQGGPDCIGVLVADASGHGIGAALMTGQTRAYLRALALTCSDVGLLLNLTNQRLSSDLQSDHFVTAFLISLDPRTRSLRYSSAGHPPGYVLGPGGQTRAVLASTGLPLGIDATSQYPESSALAIEAGDLVLLITDGIVEAVSPAGELFGMERALQLVRQHQQEVPAETLTVLFDAVSDFCKQQIRDDLTAVIIKAEGGP